MKALITRASVVLADPRKRMLVRALFIGLVLLASWFVPHHYAFAEGVLIHGGQGV